MSNLYRLVRPLLFALPPETAHRATLAVLRTGLMRRRGADDPALGLELWGRRFANPIGLTAGPDKNGVAISGWLGLGFGFVELGGVTPRPQAGNPRPRLWRWPEAQALINKLGFNNDGHAAVAARLAAWRQGGGRGLVGVNLGANKDTADQTADIVAGVGAFARLADFLVLNVSSPNTAGLRGLQARAPLTALLRAATAARAGASPPLLLKIAPDLDDAALEEVAAAALETGIDGLVVANTTLTRPAGLPRRLAQVAGGLSGRPLFARAVDLVRQMSRLTQRRLPIIGVGGVGSGADAYAMIRAGASLVALYTALVYQGPALVPALKRDLLTLLRRDGFAAVGDAIGVDA